MSSNRFLFVNGVISSSSDVPAVSAFLESHPGAYTTTRTHNNGSILLFWERHLRRLANSARILSSVNPKFIFKSATSVDSFPQPLTKSSRWEPMIRSLVDDSISKVLPVALKAMRREEELSITALVSGNWEKLREIEGVVEEDWIPRVFDVYVHVGMYLPPVFGIRENGAHLAVVGGPRDVSNAKYSDWVRLRKTLERLRPPWATELLLSTDGDHLLEGCVTNLFVVIRKDHNRSSNDAGGEDLFDYSMYPFEIQTAPISDGVLPGVIRQVIIDICLRNGIPLREVSPSWSKREMWEEAFITSSLRLLQHVETIQVPKSWKLLEAKSEKDVTWEEKRFKEARGRITALIQKEIMQRVGAEGYPTDCFI